MKRTYRIIKSDKGRITIQTNAFGTPELKIRINGETHKIQCPYGKIEDIEKMVEMLFLFGNHSNSVIHPSHEK